MYMCIYMCVCIYMCLYMCVCMYMCVYMCVCMYVCMYVCIYICVLHLSEWVAQNNSYYHIVLCSLPPCNSTVLSTYCYGLYALLCAHGCTAERYKCFQTFLWRFRYFYQLKNLWLVKSLTTIASRKLHTLTCVVLDTQKKTVEWTITLCPAQRHHDFSYWKKTEDLSESKI